MVTTGLLTSGMVKLNQTSLWLFSGHHPIGGGELSVASTFEDAELTQLLFTVSTVALSHSLLPGSFLFLFSCSF
jgi:hypothetical protein